MRESLSNVKETYSMIASENVVSGSLNTYMII